MNLRFLVVLLVSYWSHQIACSDSRRRGEVTRKYSNKSTSSGKEISERRRETNAFLKLVHDSIWNVSSTNNLDIDAAWESLEEQFRKIRTHLGAGFDVVIYNCTHPTYISLDGKRQAFVGSTQARALKSEDKCSPEDNIWRARDDPTSYLSTFNPLNSTLSDELVPFTALLDLFNYLKICEQFLHFIRHPSVFLHATYKRPASCSSSSKRYLILIFITISKNKIK